LSTTGACVLLTAIGYGLERWGSLGPHDAYFRMRTLKPQV